jgi:hypothetical protein
LRSLKAAFHDQPRAIHMQRSHADDVAAHGLEVREPLSVASHSSAAPASTISGDIELELKCHVLAANTEGRQCSAIENAESVSRSGPIASDQRLCCCKK